MFQIFSFFYLSFLKILIDKGFFLQCSYFFPTQIQSHILTLNNCYVKTLLRSYMAVHQKATVLILFLPVFSFILPTLTSLLSLSLCPSQLDLCPPLVSGESPAGTWVRVIVRAGSGRRRMQRVTSLRNGRSIGLCWKMPACIGTAMKRWGHEVINLHDEMPQHKMAH